MGRSARSAEEACSGVSGDYYYVATCRLRFVELFEKRTVPFHAPLQERSSGMVLQQWWERVYDTAEGLAVSGEADGEWRDVVIAKEQP